MVIDILEGILITFLCVYLGWVGYYLKRWSKLRGLKRKFKNAIDEETPQNLKTLFFLMPKVHDLSICTRQLTYHYSLESNFQTAKDIYKDLLDIEPYFRNMLRKSFDPFFTLKKSFELPSRLLTYSGTSVKNKYTFFVNVLFNAILIPVFSYLANLFADEIKELFISLWTILTA